MPDIAKNLRLLAHHDMGGFGNGGEGMAISWPATDVGCSGSATSRRPRASPPST